MTCINNEDKIYKKLLESKKLSTKRKGVQHGFRNNHSVIHVLTDITEKIRNALDNKNYACGVFIVLRESI